MLRFISLAYVLLVAGVTVASCAVYKLPPMPMRESYYCETEPCDAVLTIVDVAIDPGGREVNSPYVDRWIMPLHICQQEVLLEPLNFHGPINLSGYRRANTAWCEMREGYETR